MSGYAARGLHGQIVHELGVRILSGRIPEGGTLDLQELEDELGVSRTVLRESLKVLTAKGLVDARQKRGTYVQDRSRWNLLDADVLRWQAAQPTPQLLTQLAEVRSIIEPAAAALAARRHDDADIARLEDAIAAMDDQHSTANHAAEADIAFHAALLQATHNDLLAALEIVIEQGLRQRDLIVHASGAVSDPVPSHQAVLDAVRAGDAPAAEGRMHALLQQASADYAALSSRRKSAGRAVVRNTA
jgi:GntR family galactonate operon transcriptional repressor